MPPRTPLSWGTIPSLFLLPPSPRSMPCQSQRRTIRSILKPPPKPSRFDQSAKKVPAALSVSSSLNRKSYTLRQRTGVLATKKGMTALYDIESGKRTPCTVLQLDRCQVVSVKTREKHGYYAVQVGTGYRSPHNINRPLLGHYLVNEVAPKKKLVEFRVKGKEGLPPVGEELKASWFKVGQFVDAKSQNRGMGFAGGMKKWGWSGQPASHGNSLTHRAMGSAGGSQGSGSRVHPGKKMAGRMGGIQHTVQNLKVLQVDEENGIVVVKGCVSGPKKCLVEIQDAIKKPWQTVDLTLPMSMASIREEAII
ncbi:mitochondrial 54S ribosomal protein YmL9 [Tothia fuscella]|uniref:Large ribosomal subunit protein uL3m n=1 Tax=Tothia fuscella TaxID=1048955 RepID=A0A9P4U0F4_9PEZI|nr:mitochondrial 54S ribosomal protein YmL9 [Tothia fuscella]